MTQRPVHLSIADAQIISELLDDLEADGGQLPLLDGETIGRRRFDIEETRAVSRLRAEILHALGVAAKGGRATPAKKARRPTTTAALLEPAPALEGAGDSAERN